MTHELAPRATCERCGKAIELRKVSPERPTGAFRWYDSLKPYSWRCGHYDPQMPLRSHAPAIQREADLPHEYEAERGDIEIDGPCAVCGALYPAVVHNV